jgi:hypothetical protein
MTGRDMRLCKKERMDKCPSVEKRRERKRKMQNQNDSS